MGWDVFVCQECYTKLRNDDCNDDGGYYPSDYWGDWCRWGWGYSYINEYGGKYDMCYDCQQYCIETGTYRYWKDEFLINKLFELNIE